MTLRFQNVGDESIIKKRKFIGGKDSLIVQGNFGKIVTDISHTIDSETQDTASELLWIISSGFKEVGLEMDAFQVPYNYEIPEKKLFMAGELVIAEGDTDIYGDIVMYNGMRKIGDDMHVKSQTRINLELPLVEFSHVTQKVLKEMWPSINGLLQTRSGNPFIAYVSRSLDGDEGIRSEGLQALEHAHIEGLSNKPTFSDDDFLF